MSEQATRPPTEDGASKRRPEPPRPSRRTLLPAAVAGLIAAALGIFLGIGVINWFPAQASTQAHNTDRLYYVLVIASVPIFVLVVTMILYSVWQFHMRAGQEDQDGAPIHGNARLELLWTIGPVVLLLSLIGYSFVVLHDNERTPAGRELDVNVTAQQFAWTYEYPPSVTGGSAVHSTILYLPMNESVRFSMVSRDVIHAFWIPAFRLQEDVVPGIATHYRATPDRLGTYSVVCNLLCGLGHGNMRSTVVVVTPQRFKQWLQSQQGSSATTAQANANGGSA